MKSYIVLLIFQLFALCGLANACAVHDDATQDRQKPPTCKYPREQDIHNKAVSLIKELQVCKDMGRLSEVASRATSYGNESVKHFIELYETAGSVKSSEADKYDTSGVLVLQVGSRVGALLAANRAREHPEKSLDPELVKRIKDSISKEPLARVRLALADLLFTSGPGRQNIELLLNLLNDRGRTFEVGDVPEFAWHALNEATGNVRKDQDLSALSRIKDKEKRWERMKSRWESWWNENQDYTYVSKDKKFVNGGYRKVLLVNEEAKKKRQPVDERTGEIIPK